MASLLLISITGLVVGTVGYFRCAALLDHRLSGGAFDDAIKIYAAPLSVSLGDGFTPEGLAAELQSAGYADDSSGAPETFSYRGSDFKIFPPRNSGLPPAQLAILKGRVASISLDGAGAQTRFDLGTPLISTISPHRQKSQPAAFREIPRNLIDAVISIEDKRFFHHNGLDILRVAKAAYVDLKDGRKEQGASTLTMQLVRGLWLDPEKSWTRKVTEAMMTVHLEHKWSKEKIFEAYANDVYLGRDRAYAVRGFGQGARVFFGKQLREINLAEAALLAAIVQRPTYFNPLRYPERATNRRNLVLEAMRQNGFISPEQRDLAIASPLGLAAETLEEQADAPYFTDLVGNELRSGEDGDAAAKSVYTTLDLNLQRAADEALAAGLAQVDKLAAKRNPGVRVQGAVIAIDPHTGEIKALSGGRNYASSQLDRILAKRPPGSVFKPFVYAAALDSAVQGGGSVFTLASTVDDAPTTFLFGGSAYRPANFHGAYYGTITLRDALAHSMNIAAVKVAAGIGYNRVVDMARRAGMNDDIKATPSVALGSYDVTPLEIAGAYTIFANAGVYVKPSLVSEVRDAGGTSAYHHTVNSHQALDPRVAYLMVSALEEVMRTGTAAGVRGRGFLLPAAGKTGTSHDGWFAGFTSKLLCVVWVGYDDYRELNIEGARSALPVWTDFMKRASSLAAYHDAREFAAPAGITQARICQMSGKLANQYCPKVRVESFVGGSEPTETCEQHDLEPPPEIGAGTPVSANLPGATSQAAPSHYSESAPNRN